MRVALTFDAEHPDRPGCAPGVAGAMVDVLEERGIRATFFMQGRWVEAYPETARRIVRAGHLIGNHSHYHTRMPLLSEAGLAADIAEAERVITELGTNPKPWFRCPWGDGWSDPARPLTRFRPMELTSTPPPATPRESRPADGPMPRAS